MLQRFVHRYIWFGTTSPDLTTKKAWMSGDVAQQPHSEGSLEIPNVQTELLLLSARTVTRWMGAKTPTSVAVAAILLRAPRASTHLVHAPGPPDPAPLRLSATITQSGKVVIAHALAQPFVPEELRLTRSLRTRAGLGTSTEFQWLSSGWLMRDYSAYRDSLDALRRYHEDTHSTLNVHALLSTPLVGANLLVLHSGKHLSARDLPGLKITNARVGDVLEINWIEGHRSSFRCRLALYPLAPATARSFRTLCDLLVANYSVLLHHHQPADELRVSPPSRTIWRVRRSLTSTLLIKDPGPDEVILGQAQNLEAAEKLARHSIGHAVLAFAPHPLLSPIACHHHNSNRNNDGRVGRGSRMLEDLPLWGNTSGLRTLLQATAKDHARAETTARQRRAEAEHPEIAAALAALTWKAIHELPHSSSRQRLLLHQVKGLRLSGYDPTQQRRGCPHCPALGTKGGRVSHILWACPSAQALWRALRQWWRTHGAWRDRDSVDRQRFLHSIFSLRLPSTPSGVWETPTLAKLAKRDHRATTAVFPTCSVLWQQHVLNTMAVIVQWRRGMVDSTRQWTPSAATAVHSASLRGAHRQLIHSLSCSTPSWHPGPSLLSDLLASESLPPAPPERPPDNQQARRYLLFFDGGSRGNPGPGGAGAVILSVDEQHSTPSLVWSAAMSYANPATTNNLAEYWGVVTGLQAAQSNDYRPIEVIGDSALILGQHRRSRPPRNSKLLPLYATARRPAQRAPLAPPSTRLQQDGGPCGQHRHGSTSQHSNLSPYPPPRAPPPPDPAAWRLPALARSRQRTTGTDVVSPPAGERTPPRARRQHRRCHSY